MRLCHPLDQRSEDIPLSPGLHVSNLKSHPVWVVTVLVAGRGGSLGQGRGQVRENYQIWSHTNFLHHLLFWLDIVHICTIHTCNAIYCRYIYIIRTFPPSSHTRLPGLHSGISVSKSWRNKLKYFDPSLRFVQMIWRSRGSKWRAISSSSSRSLPSLLTLGCWREVIRLSFEIIHYSLHTPQSSPSSCTLEHSGVSVSSWSFSLSVSQWVSHENHEIFRPGARLMRWRLRSLLTII